MAPYSGGGSAGTITGVTAGAGLTGGGTTGTVTVTVGTGTGIAVSADAVGIDTSVVYYVGGTDVAVTDGGTGASTAAGARTNLGLGSIATQAAGAVAITGGAIDGTTIGATTVSTGAFSTLTATTAIGIASGGTALSGTPTNGQLLIGNGTGYTLAALTAGSNITITNAAGSITIAASASTGNTLDQSYDQGGAGVGRTITVDTGAVQCDNRQTSGTVFNVNVGGAVTLLGTLTGINIDLDTNVTRNGQTVTGMAIAVPSGPTALSVTSGDVSLLTTYCRRPVEAVTATKTVVAAEANEVYANDGASGAASLRAITLPSAVAGYVFTMVNETGTGANGIRVVASTGDTLQIGTVVTIAAGYAESTRLGDSVTLVAINATEWMATAFTGSWTMQVS